MPCQLLYATPVWDFELPAPLKADELTREVLHLQAKDPEGMQISNQGGWHSQRTLLDHPPLAELFHWIASCCHQAFTEIGWDFSRGRPHFNHAWAMVNGPGHSVRAHLHPHALFSGVVYLQADANSGNIAFLDPRNGAQLLAPPLQSTGMHLLQGHIERAPSPGLMLLFPAWLWHEVGSNQSDQDRVCISFNVGMSAVAHANSGQLHPRERA